MRVPWFYIKNARKPDGFWGKLFIMHMNRGHAGLTAWALSLLNINNADCVIDIGCGGGKAVSILDKSGVAKKIFGIDYSETSVECARRRNKKAIDAGRVEIIKGSVSSLPYDDDFMRYHLKATIMGRILLKT